MSPDGPRRLWREGRRCAHESHRTQYFGADFLASLSNLVIRKGIVSFLAMPETEATDIATLRILRDLKREDKKRHEQVDQRNNSKRGRSVSPISPEAKRARTSSGASSSQQVENAKPAEDMARKRLPLHKHRTRGEKRTDLLRIICCAVFTGRTTCARTDIISRDMRRRLCEDMGWQCLWVTAKISAITL